MFTGIVEAVGQIESIQDRNECKLLTISQPKNFNDLGNGDSIAVNGVCLTITEITDNAFCVTTVAETLRLTNLGRLVKNDDVNLERSLTLNSRLGGHVVQGHVDGITEIIDWHAEGDAILARMTIPPGLGKYIVKKGYVALDGMSVTVVEVTPEWFTVTFIPYTQKVTIAAKYKPGVFLNLEIDILGKYVEKLLEARSLCSQI